MSHVIRIDLGSECRDSGHGEPKMVVFETRSAMFIKYMSTGSVEKCHLQAAMA